MERTKIGVPDRDSDFVCAQDISALCAYCFPFFSSPVALAVR